MRLQEERWQKSAQALARLRAVSYTHLDKLFMPDATQSQAPYSLLHSLIFQKVHWNMQTSWIR